MWLAWVRNRDGGTWGSDLLKTPMGHCEELGLCPVGMESNGRVQSGGSTSSEYHCEIARAAA